MEPICFSNGHLPTKHLLRNRMCPFGNVKWGNRWAFAATQQAVGLDRVDVLYIKRDEKAGIGVNGQ